MQMVPVEEISTYIGKEVGLSDWVEMSQERINQFADVTEDHQFIHVDPEAAKKSPFRTTIAHGFLSLSMLTRLGRDHVIVLEGLRMAVNYGFEKVRFMHPVKSGQRIRGRFSLMSADQKLPGQWTLKYGVKVEIEGEDKPALAAEWLTMQFVKGERRAAE